MPLSKRINGIGGGAKRNLTTGHDMETLPDPAGKILLTIAIPTYNGASTLEQTLQSVLNQVTPNVEVIVSDNCSVDRTPAVVAEWRAKHDCLQYFRNEKNVGYDRNVDLAMRRAKGDFVWLLGDDDIILPGGILEVLNIISANPEVGVIYANCPHPIKLPKSAGGMCRTGDDFFARTRFKTGFVSTNVLNRKLWSDIEVSKYFDTEWIHVGFILEALPRALSYVIERYCVDYIRDATVTMRWGGDGSFIYTGMKLVRIYRQMSSLSYSRETKRKAYLSVKGAYWRNIGIAKAKGFRVDWAVIKEFIYLYKGFFSFWLIDLPLLLLPGVLFKVLLRAYKSPWGVIIFRRAD